MKKLIYPFLMIAIVTLVACWSSNDELPTPTTPPTPEPDPVPVTRSIIVYNPTTQEIGTSDGNTWFTFGTGQAANARNGFISIDDILVGIDNTGAEIITDRLPCVPVAVAIGADTWSFENIPPETAYSLGGLYRNYTQIYKNSEIYGAWYLNQYQVVDAFITDSGDVISRDTVGKLRSITEPDLLITHAEPGGLITHSMNVTTRRAYIRDSGGDKLVSFNLNYFISADQWQKSGDNWYSWNGHTWNGSTMIENGSALDIFLPAGGEAPAVIAAGTRSEHGETVLYYIECNSGILYRYTPSIDIVEQVARLYMGSGLRIDGVNCKSEIMPVNTTDSLFFTYEGTVYKYGFESGVVSSFMTGVYVWGM